MTAKKKKPDLETELIDDILSDDSPSHEDEGLLTPEVKAELEKQGGSETPALPEDGNDTVKLSESKVIAHPAHTSATTSHFQADKSVSRKFDKRHFNEPLSSRSSADLNLVQSENLKVAQEKIYELEDEITRLRTENEKLVAAAEALRTENEVLASEAESGADKLKHVKETVQQERETFEVSSKAKDRELKDLRIKMSEYEQRLTQNIQKIRVRERELENRLELVKVENAALSRNKDEMLLDLKRQVDQLHMEIDNYRGKSQQLNKQVKDKQEVLRKTVKALRLALTMLEGQVEDEAS